MGVVLSTQGLTRRYGARLAVDGLNLEIGEGDLFGLLGLNGAGKTTTMRMILQLIRPTSGRVFIFGKDPTVAFRECMSQVGSLVEQPAYYPYLSGRMNLEIVRRMSVGVPPSAVSESLDVVGLAERADDRVRTYSQGMRQRLGIAMALLARPKLVILDEPTNGLDPRGIQQIREKILEMNRRDGTTFLISSHLLHEIELTCTRVGILKEGRLVVQDRIDRLLAQAGHNIRLRAADATGAAAAALALPGVLAATVQEDGSVRLTISGRDFAGLNAALVGRGVKVEEFAPVRLTLEELFLRR
jgi:ABC-2 type transport system ATP-binding protein